MLRIELEILHLCSVEDGTERMNEQLWWENVFLFTVCRVCELVKFRGKPTNTERWIVRKRCKKQSHYRPGQAQRVPGS